MLIPIGLTDVKPKRRPWVSAGIATVCVLLTAVLATFDPVEEVDGSSHKLAPIEVEGELRTYWTAHPYIVPPEWMTPSIDPAEIQRAKAERDLRVAQEKMPDEATLHEEEKQWTKLALAAAHTNPKSQIFKTWGLVPANGFLQPGWITAVFLHGGWMHLLGNMIFFAVLGPSLEWLLGPGRFLAFYMAGGLFAGLSQFLMRWDSPTPIVGASGAIAACMGLFAVWFSHERIRLLLFLGFTPRVVEWPTWIWAGLWIAQQIYAAFSGGAGAGGVAVAAHIGGFAFGVGVALALRKTGWEERLTKEAPTTTGDEVVTPLAKAEALADRNDLPGAISAYHHLLYAEPENVALRWGLARALFRHGDRYDASLLFDSVLAKWMEQNSRIMIRQGISLVGNQIDPSALQPERLAVVEQQLGQSG